MFRVTNPGHERRDLPSRIGSFNKIDPNLQFKITNETDNIITYMDLSISRSNNKLELGIYRKPIETGTVIHFNSNHPYEQKMSAFIYYINRLITTYNQRIKAIRMGNNISNS